MSCDSLSQQSARLIVSLGSLPEGFCPSSMQELGEAFASRLIITPNQSSSSFAIGPIAPISNVGPWLKDCEQWFIWDDSSASYVVMPVVGAFNNVAVFDASGNFIVPANISRIKVEGWGGGGGGANTVAGPSGGCGGAGGGFGVGIMNVFPNQIVPVTVGLGGAGGGPGVDGGNTVVLTLTAGGGKGGPAGSSVTALGGTYSGALYGVNGQSGSSGNTFASGPGGDSGGGGGAAGVEAVVGTAQNGVAPGGGGRGGLTSISNTGNGANGRALIWY